MTTVMYEEAGISGKKTNHSLRRTAATTLFEKGVPEKVIQGVTGHRLTTGLRTYERVSVKQKQAVSTILSGSKRRFDELMEEEPSFPTKKPKVETPAASAVPNRSVPTYKQNCVVNVYPNGSAQNIASLQQNATYLYSGYGSSSPDSDYDEPFASDLPWFDRIASLFLTYHGISARAGIVARGRTYKTSSRNASTGSLERYRSRR
jgi:hypothetical protein